jgi:hypothetical protein
MLGAGRDVDGLARAGPLAGVEDDERDLRSRSEVPGVAPGLETQTNSW